MKEGMHRFRTDTRRVLDIVINSLYSHPDVFLRELVSNASDAIDRLRFESLTNPGMEVGEPRITISADASSRTLTISDNGIGMTGAEMSQNLGTIAGSGTRRFLEALSEGIEGPELIGQFGVGFYSSFMVADRVEVVSRRAGEPEPGARWASDGREGFTLVEAPDAPYGTSVILHLREDRVEYLDPAGIRSLVEKWSDYIPHPVVLDQGDGPGSPVINTRTPLWLRQERDVSQSDYDDFYRHRSGDFDPPLSRLVFHGEGTVEFHSLLFIPRHRSLRMLQPDYPGGISLHVRRVMVIRESTDLVPPCLRFLNGVVESPDLPLNISREILQRNQVIRTIARSVTRRVLDWLAALRDDEPETYRLFFDEFGDLLKEGLLTDRDHAEDLARLLLVWTTSTDDGPVSIKALMERLPEGVDRLFYVTGRDREALASSPHLEGIAAEGVEVLLFDSPMDELVIPALGAALGVKLVPLDRESADETLSDDEKRHRDEAAGRLSGLLEFMKDTLGASVREVRVSARLTDSPAMMLAARDDPGESVRSFMKAMRQSVDEVPGVLEINPDHPIVGLMERLFEENRSDGRLEGLTRVVHGLGLLLSGDPPGDPARFCADLTELLTGAGTG